MLFHLGAIWRLHRTGHVEKEILVNKAPPATGGLSVWLESRACPVARFTAGWLGAEVEIVELR